MRRPDSCDCGCDVRDGGTCVGCFPSQEEGVRLVLQAEQAGALRTHRFLYSAVDDVTVGDVRELLALYKVRETVRHARQPSAVKATREACCDHV